MKVGFFKAISWVFVLMDEINEAYGDDQNIDAKEMLEMFINISERIDLPFDKETKSKLNSIAEILDDIQVVIEDDKVTINELLKISKIICEKMGYELEDEVLSLEDFDDLESFLANITNKKEE